MAQARGIKPVGYFDCAGGGQVVVSGTTAYIAHMKAPHGTTVVDVSDPARPRTLAEITIPSDVSAQLHQDRINTTPRSLLQERMLQLLTLRV